MREQPRQLAGAVAKVNAGPARAGCSAAGRPARTSVTSSGTTARQLAWARPPRTCEPWLPTSCTVRRPSPSVPMTARANCTLPAGAFQPWTATACSERRNSALVPGQLAQGRPDEDLERDERADRVARQGEDRRGGVADGPEALRHARLHRHLAELTVPSRDSTSLTVS